MELDTIGREGRKYLPEIFAGLGIGGIFGTALFSAEATVKSVRDVDEKKKELGRDLTPKEVFKLCWKRYIKTAVLATASAACVVASDSIHASRGAALATALALSETTLKELTAKIPEIVGEEKAQEIKDAVLDEKIAKTKVPGDISGGVEMRPVEGTNEVIMVDTQEVLCCDIRFERYFKSSKSKIEEAENAINREINRCGYASLNDFYMALGLTPTGGGDELGWNSDRDGYLDIKFSSKIAPNGMPCLVIDYWLGPKEDYSSFR